MSRPKDPSIWKWPLYNWRHFAVAFALVAVALVVAGTIIGSLTAAGSSPKKPVGVRAVSAAPGFTRPTTTTAGTGVSSPPTTVRVVAPPRPVAPTSAPAPAGVIQAATRFFVAWARPSLTEPVWLAGVQPLATPDFAAGLSYTDPGSVDPHRMVGVISSGGDAGGGDVHIRGDIGTYVVAVILEPGRGYRASDIEPVSG